MNLTSPPKPAQSGPSPPQSDNGSPGCQAGRRSRAADPSRCAARHDAIDQALVDDAMPSFESGMPAHLLPSPLLLACERDTPAFEQLVRPAVVQGLGEPVIAADILDRPVATQADEHDLDLLLRTECPIVLGLPSVTLACAFLRTRAPRADQGRDAPVGRTVIARPSASVALSFGHWIATVPRRRDQRAPQGFHLTAGPSEGAYAGTHVPVWYPRLRRGVVVGYF